MKKILIRIHIFLHKLGNTCGCHQMKERTLSIKGIYFPVCARCTGIILGQIIGIILLLGNVSINIYLGLGFLLLMFLDWLFQFLGIRESTNIRRLLTGTLCGIGEVYIVVYIVLLIVK